MDKLLIEIFVPALPATYDVFIPAQSPMYEVLELIKKAVGELSAGLFVSNSCTAICHREDGSILNINLSVEELSIHNGSKLMLI